jgi:hypothetical protein
MSKILSSEAAQSRVAAKVRARASGSRTLLDGWLRFAAFLQALSAIICKQPLKVVAERAVAVKCLFVEETLDAATGANLVSATLGADRPTHLAVPATPQEDRSTCHSRGQQTHGPEPTGTLQLPGTDFLFFFHCKPEYRSTCFQHMTIRAGGQWVGRKLPVPSSRFSMLFGECRFCGSRSGKLMENQRPSPGSTGDLGVFGTLQARRKPGNLPISPVGAGKTRSFWIFVIAEASH